MRVLSFRRQQTSGRVTVGLRPSKEPGMTDVALAHRRAQMALAVEAWSDAPGGLHEVGDGYWVALTGVPSPDVNMALIHGDDATSAAKALDIVTTAGYPSIVMFGGDADSAVLGEDWQPVGAMPFMTV